VKNQGTESRAAIRHNVPQRWKKSLLTRNPGQIQELLHPTAASVRTLATRKNPVILSRPTRNGELRRRSELGVVLATMQGAPSITQSHRGMGGKAQISIGPFIRSTKVRLSS
jgi:hypothetical protein